MSVTHFRELTVWRAAMDLAKTAYRLTASFPSEQRYGLAAQLQRSAVSVPSNIAEGNGRSSTRDYARFVSMALGSVAELQTQLLLADELSMGEETRRHEALALCDRVGQMLSKLHRALICKLDNESRIPSRESRSTNPGLRRR
ncbi:MAG: four helix bundle protein [Gammaproteobacteria bacterium]